MRVDGEGHVATIYIIRQKEQHRVRLHHYADDTWNRGGTLGEVVSLSFSWPHRLFEFDLAMSCCHRSRIDFNEPIPGPDPARPGVRFSIDMGHRVVRQLLPSHRR